MKNKIKSVVALALIFIVTTAETCNIQLDECTGLAVETQPAYCYIGSILGDGINLWNFEGQHSFPTSPIVSFYDVYGSYRPIPCINNYGEDLHPESFVKVTAWSDGSCEIMGQDYLFSKIDTPNPDAIDLDIPSNNIGFTVKFDFCTCCSEVPIMSNGSPDLGSALISAFEEFPSGISTPSGGEPATVLIPCISNEVIFDPLSPIYPCIYGK